MVRRALTLDEKIRIIHEAESGVKQVDICKSMSLKKTTVCTILKNKNKILQSRGVSKQRKRLRKPVQQNIDEALLQWFRYQRSMNTTISGPILQAKAEEFAKLFHVSGFSCDSGWLHRFKKRHNISSSKIHGEAASVNMETAMDWVKSTLVPLLKNYDKNNVFNCDELGLFYKLAPDRTMNFIGEKCVGGKLSKERITVLVCANMIGTEKRKLLVIGKFNKPRCFKNVNKLPVNYAANKRAWMTADIFERELRLWDKQLIRENRHILLLVDNCPAHPHLSNLKNIKLEFFPPNFTSVLQPMDQGVIHSLKVHYRRHLMISNLKCIESSTPVAINLLDAIEMVSKAWQQVSQKTIKNCFNHAWPSLYEFDEDDDLPLNQWLIKQSEEDEDNLPLSDWLTKNNFNLEKFNPTTVDALVDVDNDLATTNMPTEEEIIAQIGQTVQLESDEDEEDKEEPPEETSPTFDDAITGIKNVKRFLESKSSTEDRILSASLEIETYLQQISLINRQKQTRITDFFTK